MNKHPITIPAIAPAERPSDSMEKKTEQKQYSNAQINSKEYALSNLNICTKYLVKTQNCIS